MLLLEEKDVGPEKLEPMVVGGLGCVWERKGVSAQGRKGYARGTAMVESAGSGLWI